ncbi:hypothetical protein GUJ93_ZPchr0013g35110 [Zizania palustris]|uniref:Uncharacterized protein n=1 Tax=Zizania palustris TaxID=103762 RepID=A0A8J6C4X1_ZIZPA|nr:hypothetical protein GUJ93_ZPchr0013g35110 [Zizania palustris]
MRGRPPKPVKPQKPSGAARGAQPAAGKAPRIRSYGLSWSRPTTTTPNRRPVRLFLGSVGGVPKADDILPWITGDDDYYTDFNNQRRTNGKH